MFVAPLSLLASGPAFSRGLLFGVEVVRVQGRRVGTIAICFSLFLPLAYHETGDEALLGPKSVPKSVPTARSR